MPDQVVDRRGTRGARTRARLLEAARHVLAGVPWQQARVEDVCRAAGVGHGTYYAYFANKADIVRALVRGHAADLYRLTEAPFADGDVREDVRRVVDGYVLLTARDRDIREIWATAAEAEPPLAELVDEVRGQVVLRLRAQLVRAQRAGAARPDLDVEVAAPALAAMVEHTAARPPAGVSRRRLVDALTDLWVHAVHQA